MIFFFLQWQVDYYPWTWTHWGLSLIAGGEVRLKI